MSKNAIFTIVIVILVAATGLLLYRSFSSQPLQFIPTTVSGGDIVIRNQIDSLDVRIKKAVKKLDAGGALDELSTNPQFQKLSTDAIRPIVVGVTGRSNPFLRVDRTQQ